MEVIKSICQRVISLERGFVAANGATGDVIAQYKGKQ